MALDVAMTVKVVIATWLLLSFPLALLIGAFLAEGPFGKHGEFTDVNLDEEI